MTIRIEMGWEESHRDIIRIYCWAYLEGGLKKKIFLKVQLTVFQAISKIVSMHWTLLGKKAFPGLFKNVYLSNVFWQKMP